VAGEGSRRRNPRTGTGAQGAVTVGRIVRQLLGGLKLSAEAWLQDVESEWPRTVGAAVAARTRPGRFEDGVLTVYVNHSVWYNELTRYGKADMLANLRRRYGDGRIRSLRLQLDPGR